MHIYTTTVVVLKCTQNANITVRYFTGFTTKQYQMYNTDFCRSSKSKILTAREKAELNVSLYT